MGKLHDLHSAGQSVWLDFIRRDMLVGGDLEEMVQDGIRGLTSNPTIFQKAIAGSNAYDDAIRAALAAKPDSSPMEIYEGLAIADIQDAADTLRGVYDESAARGPPPGCARPGWRRRRGCRRCG